MRIVSSLVLALVFLLSAGCDLLTPPDKGYFYLMNDSSETLPITVSERDDCVIGLKSSVPGHTWRNYDLEDKANGAWLCIDKKPYKVVDGKSYKVQNGQVTETEAPQF